MAHSRNRAVKEELRFNPFRMFLFLCLTGAITMMLVGYTMLKGEKYEENDAGMPAFVESHADDSQALKEVISEPIILWWTPFTGEKGAYRRCGQVSCFFTVDRHYWQHQKTKAVVFYGTDLRVHDLPMPRKPEHEWALLHEESPKNNLVLHMPAFIPLFNHTATFRRGSDLPLTLQHLEDLTWLESTKYLVSTEQKNRHEREASLAAVSYTQSDCNVPCGRDNYVRELMKEMTVDSYGSCVHNKDLPKHLVDPIAGMEHTEFYHLMARYKFTLAMENAICDDYVTEKVWRPLMLGSVPVIRGSPKIKDILPDDHSAIIIDDFKSPKELANYLNFLDRNDQEYNKYLSWKKTGVTNPLLKEMLSNRSWSIVETWKYGRTNFIEDFECLVCNRLHSNIKLANQGKPEKVFIADESHLVCPRPEEFSSGYNSWLDDWNQNVILAEAARYFADKNLPITKGDLHAKQSEISYQKKNSWF
ncbi:alpha-(1,3)-fucosyltransferase 10-like [Mya arenaria]|uniref:alpha-(1,3)-fucosyltransferase 10-like n=1 Tax=Mya arenaria TaxID=6604 RepID=UPI0022DF732A|nr:alpha-(1,3)-fucosyltransferase 10-like [Mya arenaria]